MPDRCVAIHYGGVALARLVIPLVLLTHPDHGWASLALAPVQYTDCGDMVYNSGFNRSVLGCPYARLPAAARQGTWCDPHCPVRPAVWGEGQNGAGLYIGFASDATEIWLNVTLLKPIKEAANCAAVCGSGLDMYAWDPVTLAWRWVATTKNSGHGGGWNLSGTNINRAMVTGAPVVPGSGKLIRYRIHLPIYNGVLEASLGVVGQGSVLPDPNAIRDAGADDAIVFYGTSIVNGHVASRPGMIFTNVLSRMLDRPVINLGFGGNGEMEVSVGRLIVELREAGLLVIDCNWNMSPDQIRANAPTLVRQLRHAWSATKPILLAEGSSAGAAWLEPGISDMQTERRAALAAAFAELTAAGIANLHYQKGDELIGASGDTDLPTAMGTHPTDLGHSMIAEHYAKLIPTLLQGGGDGGNGGDVRSSSSGSGSGVSSSVHLPPPPAFRGETECAPVADDYTRNIEAAEMEARQARPFDRDSVAWTDAKTLAVGGREDWGGLPRENFYDRFPVAAKADVDAAHKSIWGLSKCSSGEYIGFKLEGNASRLFVCFNNSDSSGQNPSGGRLSIMPPLGRKGVDLYGQSVETGTWIWAANAVGSPSNDSFCGALTSPTAYWPGAPTSGINSSAASRFIMYLPLWRACSDDLTIGIPAEDHAAGARIVPDDGGIDAERPPVVWYGTSIVHGAAVTRAGESFTNRVSRGLNRTVYNFGFSGSGHMDLGIGKWLRKINASVFIVDCDWNMNAAEITAKTGPYVRTIREVHPTTPIVIAEGSPDGDNWFLPAAGQAQDAKNAALRGAFEALRGSDPNLHYVNGTDLFGDDPTVNPTVGGCHPSDLGAHKIAAFYTAFLPSLLQS